MQYRRHIISSLLLLLGLSATVASGQEAPIGALLSAPVDARATAMGGLTLQRGGAERSLGQALYLGPSRLFDAESSYGIALSGTLYPSSASSVSGRLMRGALSGGWRIGTQHAVYAGARYEGGLSYSLQYSPYETRDQRVAPFGYTVDLGYAYRLDPIVLYATGSFLQSYTGRGSYGAALGIGASCLTRIQERHQLAIDLRVQDIGLPMYFGRKGYALPTRMDITADMCFANPSGQRIMDVALGGSYTFTPLRSTNRGISLGVEVPVQDFLDLRAGYRYNSHLSSVVTAGIGLRYCGWMLDCSYLHTLSRYAIGHQWTATLAYDF